MRTVLAYWKLLSKPFSKEKKLSSFTFSGDNRIVKFILLATISADHKWPTKVQFKEFLERSDFILDTNFVNIFKNLENLLYTDQI